MIVDSEESRPAETQRRERRLSVVMTDAPGPDVEDLDSCEADPIFVREYAAEVFDFCRTREVYFNSISQSNLLCFFIDS